MRTQRCQKYCFLLSLLLFSALFSLCIHLLEDTLLFSSAIVSVSRPHPQNSISVSKQLKQSDNDQQDSGISNHKLVQHLSQQSSGEVEPFRNEWGEFDRILYIQRNYHRFNTPEMERKRNEVIRLLNSNSNQLERNVVFQEMKETGLGNSLLAVASSYIVSRLLNASFQGFV